MSSTRTQNSQQDLQNVAVILHFTSGDFNQGFNISLRINNNGICEHQENFREKLPPAPEIPPSYQEWAKKYEDMGLDWADITPVDGVKTNEANFDSCTTAASTVQQKLSEWFESREFSFLSAHIQSFDLVKRDKSVPVIFNFDTSNIEVNEQLRKLPWHQWSLFRRLRQAEVAISLGPRKPSPQIGSSVRILAVFGSDQGGLSLQEDKESLEGLLLYKGAEIVFLDQPTAEEFEQNLYDSKGWDILLFTGHSDSDLEDGKLLLSKDHAVSLSVFEDAFGFAIQKGLKIAIFNSCKGLGIANFFSGWNGNKRFPGLPLPSIIVMREQVPDFVARRFFREFLHQFTSGEPIYRAVREARNRLAFLDGERVDQDRKKQPYPCASWIPVVCLNPNQPEISWPPSRLEPITPPPPPIKWIVIGVCIAAATFAGVFAWRIFGRGDVPPSPQPIGSSLERNDNSIGDKTLLDPEIWEDVRDPRYKQCFENAELKEASIAAFSRALNDQSWDNVTAQLEAYREACKVDPEALIYLNNARAFNSGRPILRVAVVVPIGDPQTVGIAQELLRGYAHAQEVINEDTIGGRVLQLQIVNDTSGQSVLYDSTEAIATALSEDQAIIAVLGSYTSGSTQIASEIYASQELVSVSSTSTAVRNDEFELNEEYVFRVAPTDAKAATDIASVIQQLGYKNIGIVYESDDPYSRSLKQANERALADIEGVETFAPNECDLSGGFSANRCVEDGLTNVDAVLLLPSTEIKDDVERVILRLDDDIPLFAGDSVFGGKTLGEVGTKVDGMIVSVPWHVSTASFISNDFFKKAEELLGFGPSAINWRTALSFSSARSIAGALNQMPSLEDEDDNNMITRGEINNLSSVLRQGVFDGFLGDNTIDFDENGDRLLSEDSNLGTIVQVQCRGTSNDTCEFVEPTLDTEE